ncbi:hypothetical protein LCGC14_2627410 [marine sediment metagenome]|uniref:WLM domain-containing protein n=1 Tax=marine sediment metagenome TaxID=412755 RepID=A0A0F9A171_9ZZZZ
MGSSHDLPSHNNCCSQETGKREQLVMSRLTAHNANLRCLMWQRRLSLVDWRIKVIVARLAQLGEGTLGDCDITRVKRQAQIRLLDLRDVGGQQFHFDGESWDWELTLVHELLHLHISDCFHRGWPGAKSEAGMAAERMIDALARALLAGYRK